MDNNQRVSLSAERRIILVIVLSALAGIVLVGGALKYSLQRAALAQCWMYLEGRASVLASQCDGEITEALRDLQFLAGTSSFQQLPYVDQIDVSINGVPENVDVEKRRLLIQMMNKAERFSVLYVLRPNADIYVLEPFRLQPKLTKHNLSDRPYYQEAVRTKAPVISDSFVGADGELAVVILVPILADNGDVIGYLGGAFHLTSRLSQLVTKDRIKPFDAGYIVDRKGLLIAHTDTALLREGFRERFAELHPLVSRFLASAGSQTGANSEAVIFDEYVDPTDAKRYLTVLAPLRSGWGLGLMRDRAAVIAETSPAVWGITFLVGLLLALIGGFSVAFAHGIGRHWDNAEHALRISEKAIKELNKSLEWRVKQRTTELEIVEAFSYSVSHDLRAPLRSMDGFSKILLEEYRDKLTAQGQDYLQRVRKSCQHMAELIEGLLGLAQVSRKEMKFGKVDFSQLAGSIAEELKSSAPERKVEFIIQPQLSVNGDNGLLRIVLGNLLDNAFKFTAKHPGAKIEFGATDIKDERVYFVADDGAGFDMVYVDKLFVPFQRLHTTVDFSGTGIGLVTVKRIINRHGGRVWAEGKVGQGTTVYFTLGT